MANLAIDSEQPSIRRSAAPQWMLAAFATALALVALVRLYGPAYGQLTAAPRVTARWSFVLVHLAQRRRTAVTPGAVGSLGPRVSPNVE
jgi:hypothetical protein